MDKYLVTLTSTTSFVFYRCITAFGPRLGPGNPDRSSTFLGMMPMPIANGWEGAFQQRLNMRMSTPGGQLPHLLGGDGVAIARGDIAAAGEMYDYGWYKENSEGMTHPVGEKEAKPLWAL